MVGWQRYIRSVLSHVQKRVELSYNVAANSNCNRLQSSLSYGQLPYLQRLLKSSPVGVAQPYYRCLQQMGISSSRMLLADKSEEAAVSSPLTSALALSSGKGDKDQKVISKPSKVQAILKGIKQVK